MNALAKSVEEQIPAGASLSSVSSGRPVLGCSSGMYMQSKEYGTTMCIPYYGIERGTCISQRIHAYQRKIATEEYDDDMLMTCAIWKLFHDMNTKMVSLRHP